MMEGSTPAPPERVADSQAELSRPAQFLATEHWSLLATRSMSWNEAFSRTAMFLGGSLGAMSCVVGVVARRELDVVLAGDALDVALVFAHTESGPRSE